MILDELFLNPLSVNLEYVFKEVASSWEFLRNKKIFLTGGTGFFGCWFLETFICAVEKLNLNARVTVLTRNKDLFIQKYPKFGIHTAIDFYLGDVTNFTFPDQKFSYVIHAATETAGLGRLKPKETLNTIVQGTQRVLDFAVYSGVTNFLFISSGAVYGVQPPDVMRLHENHSINLKPNDINSYGIGKFTAEHLCHLYQTISNIKIKIARCFTFIGPFFPLNSHFASSHFFQNGLDGKPIIVTGNRYTYRSYMHAADLMIWLWQILFLGSAGRPYNVGSSEAITIFEFANLVAKYSPYRSEVIFKNNFSEVISRYIPDVERASNELKLKQQITIEDSIKSTFNWYQGQAQPTLVEA